MGSCVCSLLQSTITQNAIHRITSWYVDEKSPDVIAIFTKGEGGSSGKADEYACLVLKTNTVRQPPLLDPAPASFALPLCLALPIQRGS